MQRVVPNFGIEWMPKHKCAQEYEVCEIFTALVFFFDTQFNLLFKDGKDTCQVIEFLNFLN